MLYTKEQVMNGIISYIDSEVIPKLSTLNKIMIGTGVALAVKNCEPIFNEVACSYGSLLGVVNNEGLIDIDTIASELKENAEKYGNVQISIPFGGVITFKSDDIDILRRYIT